MKGPLWNIALDEQTRWWEKHFDGPSYRLKQLKDWVFKKMILDGRDMKNLPADIKEKLKEHCRPVLQEGEKQVSRGGEADKYVFICEDGSRLESVMLRSGKRRTLCLSTQVGCALGCTFCHTGLMGFKRNLSVAEMVEQVIRVSAGEDQRLSNIVVMGMGEPFLNYENLMTALRLINAEEGIGLGARHVTVSTSGIRGGILKLAGEKEQWGLAVSLHGADDDLRSELMPINRSFNISELLEEVDQYILKTNRRVTFEYIMLSGVNGSRKDANKLAGLLKNKLCHINLIPYNPVPSLPYKASQLEELHEFKDILQASGLACTIRIEKGQDILAACGQLAHQKIHAG